MARAARCAAMAADPRLGLRAQHTAKKQNQRGVKFILHASRDLRGEALLARQSVNALNRRMTRCIGTAGNLNEARYPRVGV